MILNLFRRSQTRETIERLYGAIVAQARQPVFYTDFHVPDTAEGRLELLMLHVHLSCRRLGAAEGEVRALSQEVFDAFLADMDSTLREMGIGDLSVPKKMKKIGNAFYDRAAAYDAALAETGPALAEALSRNLFERYQEAGLSGRSSALAAYVRDCLAALGAQADSDFARGRIAFPLPRAEEATQP